MYHFQGTLPRLTPRYTAIDVITIKRDEPHHEAWKVIGLPCGKFIELILARGERQPTQLTFKSLMSGAFLRRSRPSEFANIRATPHPSVGVGFSIELSSNASFWMASKNGQHTTLPFAQGTRSISITNNDDAHLVCVGLGIDLTSTLLADNTRLPDSILEIVTQRQLPQELNEMLRFQRPRLLKQPFLLCAALFTTQNAESYLHELPVIDALMEKEANE